MHEPPMLVTRLVTSLALLIATTLAVAAQSFAPVAQVNDSYITSWELQQRQRMLAVLNAPPEAQAEALDSLINERLQLQAAESVGATVSDEQIQSGVDQFASQGNLSGEEFLRLISNEGVDPSTIREFVRAGVAWREAVRARFGPEVNISDHEVAREKEEIAPDSGPSVLLSEIVLPAGNQVERVDSEALAEEIRNIRSVSAFSAAAQEHSTAPSAEEGGRVGWIPLADLQGPVGSALQGLQPGQVTRPIEVPNGIALFQLRSISEGPAAPGGVVLDYAQYLIPGGRTDAALREAARIEARVDTCDDLYGVAEGQPPSRLVREELPVSQIPADVRSQLATLDRNEVSTALTRGGALVFLMLCERDVGGELAISDTAISVRLENEELAGRAAIWLAELRNEAYIRIGGE